MKKSEYICDICGDKITTDEINSGKTSSNKIYGLYYACDATRWENRLILIFNKKIPHPAAV